MSRSELLKVGERVVRFPVARRLCHEMTGWDGTTGPPSAARLVEPGVDTSVLQVT